MLLLLSNHFADSSLVKALVQKNPALVRSVDAAVVNPGNDTEDAGIYIYIYIYIYI